MDPLLVARMVEEALREDVGSGDVTADLIPALAQAEGTIISREPGVLCGSAWVTETFFQLDPSISVRWNLRDGDRVAPDQPLCVVAGNARALVSGERVALNFLQTLSGTATRTRAYVDAVAGTRTRILDTRKTIPGWRAAQKYAVRQGGAVNHRHGLYDAILIKENHIAAAGSVLLALTAARRLHPTLPLEVEVETLAQLREALSQNPDRILLDNFSENDLRLAIDIRNRHSPDRPVPLEVSGGVSRERVVSLASLGIEFISVGDLTKNLQALDLSFRLRQVQAA